MENTNTQEMFILSKYKYIRYLTKSAESTVKLAATNLVQKELSLSKISTTEKSAKEIEKELKEKKLADKLKKKEQMKEMCKPSDKKEKKVKYVEKEKFVNNTPHGEKKGK